mmetsp:Transcript_2353/g.15731  ORF Transcript_2353/g.15731 Transcript_2353/m.15731 type:complete len:194 (+) Transcript_2353:116-697(+)|eukprot:CAMPEP_0183823636 /NCGR_PEP_ID=MMETSP0807_2-20130328/162_1 /TAXON_ID=88271 /ORGANISM="Picocystis salinarum, Strain CCMP1897" /LENGTH=193 /DNA_ID=CAMNT_0026068541 /DNA_START=100 /DNA_END=681 /DNA_ORIENTATION=-
MKQVLSSRTLQIPEGVDVTVVSRKVTVKGPRGTLTKEFRHLRLDVYLVEDEEGNRMMKVDAWSADRKTLAAIRTICSHVDNLITGVTKGFRYKMRLVYAHFPININILGKGEAVEIRNFLGEKRVRKIVMQEGVVVIRDNTVKDQILLEGNDIENVSRSAAHIHQSVLIKRKDIRKFLDGIFVSGKETIVQDE